MVGDVSVFCPPPPAPGKKKKGRSQIFAGVPQIGPSGVPPFCFGRKKSHVVQGTPHGARGVRGGSPN